MPTRALKTKIARAQGNDCALSGVDLQTDPSLNDAHRLIDRAEGGDITFDNVAVAEPLAHMAHHGILRERDTSLDTLKSLYDDRVQMLKLMLKINNQLLALQRRTDATHPETQAFLQAQLLPIKQRLSQIDGTIQQWIKDSPDPLVRSAMGVRGLGPMTIAALLVYVDLGGVYTEHDRAVKTYGTKTAGQEKCPTASSLWRYVGLDKSAKDRYEKGVASGGNKTLRTALWNAADVMMKMRTSAYRTVYENKKAQLAASNIIVTSRNTQGKWVDVAWKDTKPSHRHGAALRAVMKHLLADYWYVGRTLAGLPTRPLYVEEKLGHTGIIQPRERGWVY